jgi:hypothetical protein
MLDTKVLDRVNVISELGMELAALSADLRSGNVRPDT